MSYIAEQSGTGGGEAETDLFEGSESATEVLAAGSPDMLRVFRPRRGRQQLVHRRLSRQASLGFNRGRFVSVWAADKSDSYVGPCLCTAATVMASVKYRQ